VPWLPVIANVASRCQDTDTLLHAHLWQAPLRIHGVEATAFGKLETLLRREGCAALAHRFRRCCGGVTA